MVRKLCFVLALLLIPAAGWAENTQSEQDNSPEGRACRGDAHRFCRQEIPDEFRVASCLQTHRDQLSRACRAALEGHGM